MAGTLRNVKKGISDNSLIQTELQTKLLEQFFSQMYKSQSVEVEGNLRQQCYVSHSEDI